INFTFVVLATFAIGSALAAFAGVMNGLYYNEINFGMGLLLGVFGFSAAVVGGLGNIYGAILGGFLFAGLQTIGAVALPFASAYKDVFALAVVIAIMAWRPTGLIAEKARERVWPHGGADPRLAAPRARLGDRRHALRHLLSQRRKRARGGRAAGAGRRRGRAGRALRGSRQDQGEHRRQRKGVRSRRG